MADCTILTSDSNTARQTKLDGLTAGDTCTFEVGTHNWGPGEYNTLIGSASAAAVVDYVPAGAGVILKKDPLTKTEPIFKVSTNTSKRHNILIDGDGKKLTFDGAGIFVKEGGTIENLEIKEIIAKNFYQGANDSNGAGRFLELNQASPDLHIHDNTFGPANSGSRWASALILYINGDDVTIHDNIFTEIYQPAQIHGSGSTTGAPTGFRYYNNTVTGCRRANIESWGVFINPMYYFNKISDWRDDGGQHSYMSSYPLSIVSPPYAYGAQIFGNVCDGGRHVFPPDANGSVAGIRIGIEDAGNYSFVFGNLINGCNTGYNTTGGAGQYFYGNRISNNLTTTAGSPSPIKNDGSHSTKPTYSITRAADAGTDATATASVSGGKLVSLSITGAGTNYKKTLGGIVCVCPPKVKVGTVTPGGATRQATVLAYVNPSTFVLEGFVIIDQGAGYSGAPDIIIDRTAVAEANVITAGSTTDYPIPSGGTVPAVTDEDAELPTDRTFLSDIHAEWLHDPETINGWGPIELDTSNGEDSPLDGTTIKIGSGPRYAYQKGIGCHAPCVIPINLVGKGAIRFKAEVGVDDEVGTGNGSLVFEVRKNQLTSGAIWSSPPMTWGNQPVEVDLDITGWTKMYLVVASISENLDYDHADWGNAGIVIGQASEVGNGIKCFTVDLEQGTLTKLYADNTTEMENLV